MRCSGYSTRNCITWVVISLNRQNPNFERVVRDSFAAQRIMSTLGANLTTVSPGNVEIQLPFHTDFTQQHGFLHAGVVTTILDSACGYAALSLMSEGVGVLSIEFKTNLLAPARGDLLIARAEVVRRGRTITVCKADGLMTTDGEESLVATMLATIMTVRDRPEVVG
jgi:uncharacterized protein (TIGR00369 family)